MIKVRLFLLIMSAATCYAHAQKVTKYRQPIEDNLVPSVVRTNFKTQYPRAIISIWYSSHITYWYEDYITTWYGDWHIARPTTVHTFEFPTYYEVDFYRNEQNTRAIYNRYGQWFETRTKITALPDDISDKLKNSEYGDWSWSQHKERIEAPGMPGSVYRFEVGKGREYRIIRISDQGEIIQVKYD